jgi:hypothetical protein
MVFLRALVGLAALLAFSPAAQGFTLPCFYEEYKCGFTYAGIVDGMSLLIRSIYIRHQLTGGYKGYNTTELTTAAALNPTLPGPLTTAQLNDVLFRCVDTIGTLVADSFCIAGCISIGGDTVDDLCAM